MPNFRIIMKWTQSGLDEIGKAADRRGYAIALMQADFPAGGANQIVFRNSTTKTPPPVISST
jgi:hypothetical protein